MAGVATVQREGLVININLQPYVILLFTEFLFSHLKQKKKKWHQTKTGQTVGKETKEEKMCLLSFSDTSY